MSTKRSRLLVIAVSLVFLGLASGARQTMAQASGPVLVVESGKRFANIASAINDVATVAGNTIKIDAGTRLTGSDAVASITKEDLKITGILDSSGNRPVLDATGAALPNNKGMLLVDSGSGVQNFTVSNLEFTGAQLTAAQGGNGSGVRYQGQGNGTLTITNCYFHDNQMGVLTGPPSPNNSVIIQNSVFDHQALEQPNNLSHNMYIDANSFTLRNSFTHDSQGGHEVKTRSAHNYILYNKILDEHGASDYDIDIPNGGESYIIGNVIEQAPCSPVGCTQNTALVEFEAEGLRGGYNTDLYVVNNTFVNTVGTGTYVKLFNNPTPPTATITNNIFSGNGTVSTGGTVTASNNYTGTSPNFQDPVNYDYHLTSTSPSGSGGIVDAGISPGVSPEGQDLTPTVQYVEVAQSSPRTIQGSAIDLGAFEFSSIPADPTPPVISGVVVSNITDNSATISWNTDDPSDSVVEYSVDASYSSTSTLTTLTSNHTITITGLLSNTLYNFRVNSTNGSGLSSTSAGQQFRTASAPSAPIIIGGPSAINITQNSATITWMTDQATDSRVEYSIDNSFALFVASATLVTTHSMDLTGLAAGTTYNYRVKSRNAAGVPVSSFILSFQTAQDTTAPVILSGPTVTNITSSGATVSWTTDDSSDSQVEYALNSTFSPSSNTLNATLVTSHTIALTGLNPSTLYYVRVHSTNAASLSTISATVQFSTLTPSDTIKPVVSITAPTNGSTIQGVVSIVVHATDDRAVVLVNLTEVGPKNPGGQSLGSLSTLGPDYVFTWDTNDPTRGENNGTILLTASAADAAGNLGTAQVSVTLNNDTTPPVITAGPTVAIQIVGTTATATISWQTNEASTTSIQYGLEGASGTFTYGAWIDNLNRSTSHQVVLSNLQLNSRYHYQIRSCDAANNCTY